MKARTAPVRKVQARRVQVRGMWVRNVRRVQVRRAPSLRPGRRATPSRLGSRAGPGPRATLTVASQSSWPHCPCPCGSHQCPWSMSQCQGPCFHGLHATIIHATCTVSTTIQLSGMETKSWECEAEVRVKDWRLKCRQGKLRVSSKER